MRSINDEALKGRHFGAARTGTVSWFLGTTVMRISSVSVFVGWALANFSYELYQMPFVEGTRQNKRKYVNNFIFMPNEGAMALPPVLNVSWFVFSREVWNRNRPACANIKRRSMQERIKGVWFSDNKRRCLCKLIVSLWLWNQAISYALSLHI